ncbi:PPE family protein [Mycobacterium numidiamassiliense]|uniref:PPE family protein n=1 Tax=Mycobacterium numidiamassiliense TaxID=1841861 RepID=UPI002481A95C|nr:PPE family protein [Mycobacterium numidiamassiliense]
MIPALDFAVLPPEVNSGRMYSGAGPGPLLAAASSWNGIAAELRAAALSYGSVLSELTERWQGPTSAAMIAATTPYVAWLNSSAASAETTAAQAGSAVAAYEAAFAATVPPAVIAANRTRLMTLIATNFLGQNTPAIAATEAEYGEMWAQDAGAMYGYAAASAVATELTPFDAPEQTTSLGGLAAQSAAVDQAAATSAGASQSTVSQLVAAVPSALQGLATPTAAGTGVAGALDDLGLDIFAPGSASSTTGLAGLMNAIFGTNTAFGQFLNSTILNTIFASAFFMPARFLGHATDFISLSQQSGAGATGAAAGAAPGAATGAGPGGIEAIGGSVAVNLGEGNVLGPLSVPPGWTATAPGQSPLSPALGGAPMAAPPSSPAPVTGSTPPVPMGANMGARGEGRAVPQYGFRPSFVARPPAAG